MIKNIAYIIFGLLFMFNYETANYVYSGSLGIEAVIANWAEISTPYTYFRFNLFEVSFFVIVIASLLRDNKYSRSVLISLAVVITFSMLDKLLLSVTYRMVRDLIIIAFAFLMGTLNYKYEN